MTSTLCAISDGGGAAGSLIGVGAGIPAAVAAFPPLRNSGRPSPGRVPRVFRQAGMIAHSAVPTGILVFSQTAADEERKVPTGKVKWYDTDKGFGFLTSDQGEDVFVHGKSLPTGMTTLKAGTRVEYGVMDGKKGKTALSLKVLEPTHSVVKAKRKPADQMTEIIETLIKLLDDVSTDLHKGHYPADAKGKKVAAVLRAVADDLDA
ncbi:MAG: cold-shock protein [Candidatus Nanopelagicales bacterium]